MPGRVFGYIRASVYLEIESPEGQRQTIQRYCQRVGLELVGCYVDRASSSRLPLLHREAGRLLCVDLRRGDHLVIARFDRLSDSFNDAALSMDGCLRKGIILHFCDIPGGLLDPGLASSRLLVQLVVSFAQYERCMIGSRVRESFAKLKAEGRRFSRHAPFGFKWERRGRKTLMVPVPEEQEICVRVAELYSQGHPLDQLRQYLAYTWKVKNRRGNEFGYTEVRNMAARGADFLSVDGSHEG